MNFLRDLKAGVQNFNKVTFQFTKRVSKGKSAQEAVNELQDEGLLPTKELIEEIKTSGPGSSSSSDDDQSFDYIESEVYMGSSDEEEEEEEDAKEKADEGLEEELLDFHR